MISKIIETFVNELQREETQLYITEVLDPYLYKYKYYLCLITFTLFSILVLSSYNTYILHNIKNINI